VELGRLGWEAFIFTDVAVAPTELSRDLGCDLAAITLVRLDSSGQAARGPRELDRLRTLRRHTVQIRSYGLDLFVNCKFKSTLPGCGRRSIYYCHFPHHLSTSHRGLLHRGYLTAADLYRRAAIDRNVGGFLCTYDDIWANSVFTAHHTVKRWGRRPDLLYPPCAQVRPGAKDKVIATVGRFQAPGDNIPYKAQDVLLETFAQLRDLHDDGWRLVMVGGADRADEGYLEHLRRRASGLPVDLIVNGSRRQLEEVLGRASLYWHAQGVAGDPEKHPETQEHFGISTVEAMSAGAIPLVYGAAGPAEVVAGLPGVAPWFERDQLADLTRHWAACPDGDLADARRRCVRRAQDFGPSRFAHRLAMLT
jgi:glycosyltransferase involved in cell wall biosynthesis